MALYGLSFEEADHNGGCFHSSAISFSWIFFGDPYAPGWLTPANTLCCSIYYRRPNIFGRTIPHSVPKHDCTVIKTLLLFDVLGG